MVICPLVWATNDLVHQPDAFLDIQRVFSFQGLCEILSNDKTGVYSVFTVQVHEVIKNSSQLSLPAGSSIEVERDGGRVRFPNGRTLIYIATNMPQVGLRYVLFLTNAQSQSDFQILTGYELREGKVYPLDDLPNLHTFENADETTFLNQLRTAKSFVQ